MISKTFNSSLLYRILFVVSLAILLFISALTYKHIQNVSASSNLVVHTYKVNLKLEQLISYLKDAETGVQSYVVTHDANFLKPYSVTHEKVNDTFITLKTLTADNRQQQQNLSELFVLIKKSFEIFDANIKNFEELGRDNKKQFEQKFVIGQATMQAIRDQINKMIAMENSYLVTRNKEYAYQIYITPILTIGIIFLALLFIILSYIKINKDILTLQQSNDNLNLSKSSSDQSEILGNYSSWRWNLDDDVLYYSDNLYQLLGCEPQEFEATNFNFIQYVHPEDVKLVEDVIENIIKNENLPYSIFRIIRKDGEVRFFKSIGKMVIDSFKKRIIIGTTSDVTAERLANIAIEDQNLELIRSNNELASFNYVASHDLQEPLRKIQTFISRFSDQDKSKISENGQNYLFKIEESVNRMRTLIDDLLLFSRTNKSEKIFKPSNLNELLENALQQLSQTIYEKKAVIEKQTLPFLDVIPFQIEQLFANLISNSLKYSSPNRPSIIKITSEKIQASTNLLLKNSGFAFFYKISFSDNGLGFDAQFNEKIFVLFNRLHSKNDYPGTGIGLTICRKIAENHKGFIVADGIPNEGATFTFYIPLI